MTGRTVEIFVALVFGGRSDFDENRKRLSIQVEKIEDKILEWEQNGAKKLPDTGWS